MHRFVLAAGLVVAVWLALVPAVHAATIEVDSNADTAMDTGTCTLREAIIAANTDTASGGMTGECEGGAVGGDEITFTDPPFNGGAMMTVPQSTITTSGLPDITDDLTITGDGPTCINTLDKPCVGVSVSPGGSNEAFKITGNADVTITGVAITGASVGIDSLDGLLTVNRLWVGLTLNQAVPLGNTTGILLGDDAIVGNQVAGERNLFVANTIGVNVFGGNNNSIRGSDFGIRPAGTTTDSYANGTSIRVADEEGVDTAVNTTIGNPDDGTPELCDGGCNLIANANGDGIDLSGVGAGEDPATGPTDIAGNFIGVTVNGANPQPNDGDGVDVGAADDVTVGGPSTPDRNLIGGNGAFGVTQGDDAEDFSFQNNYVGVTSTVAGEIPDTLRGLSALGGDAEILDNLFGGSSVLVGGDGATVQGNAFGIGPGGEDVGIGGGDSLAVTGIGVVVGGTAAGDGNLIGNSDGASNSALSIEGDSAVVRGNRVGVGVDGQAHPNEGNGITVAPSAVADNVIIGGTGAGAANVISNSGADAIRVPDAATINTAIRGNSGRDNGSDAADLFIDLGLDGPGNATTNAAIQPPTVTSATATQIQGTSTEANGTAIDVYRTITDRGDVHSYLGTAGVAGGTWSLTYPVPLGSGVCVTAAHNESLMPKGSSELAPTTTIGGGPCDVTGPTSTIDSGPEEIPAINDTTPTFEFSASEPGSTFECSIDAGAFSACASPFTTSVLAEGDHDIRVRATDPAENTGPPSATRSFEIDLTAPETTVTSFRKRPLRRRAVVTFTSNDPTATFQCKLNARAFAPCATPSTFRRLKRGKRHTIQVRALDAAGNVDATPTTNRIRIPRRRR